MKKVCKICEKEFVTLTNHAKRCPACRNLAGIRIPKAKMEPSTIKVAHALWKYGFVTWEGTKETHLGRKKVMLVKRSENSEPLVVSFVHAYPGVAVVAYLWGRDMDKLRFRPNCPPTCKGCFRCELAAELNGEDVATVKRRTLDNMPQKRMYLQSYKRRGRVRHYIANLKPITTSDKLPDEQPTELPEQQDDVLQEI